MLLASVTCAQAQERYIDESTGQSMILRYKLGGYGGFTGNFHAVRFGAFPGYSSCCAAFDNSFSTGFAFGVLSEFTVGSSLILDTRIGFSAVPGTFSQKQIIGNEPVLEDGKVGQADRRDVTVEHSLTSSVSLLTLEPVLRYHVSERISLLGGMRIGYAASTSYEQREVLVSPEGYVFLDGSAIRNQQSGQIPTATALNLHAALGAQYIFIKQPSYSMGLDLRYYMPLTAVADVDWKVHSLHAGIALAFGVYTPVTAIERNDTVYVRDTSVVVAKGLTFEQIELDQTDESEDSYRVADTLFTVTTIKQSYVRKVPKSFDPGLEVRLVAQSNDGSTKRPEALRIQEMDVIESYPVLPQIFFAENSSVLSQTGQNILDSSAMASFSPASLTRSQLSVYNNLLNIVGQRMSLSPDAKITVSGYGSNQGPEQGNRDIARQRAESIRSYLTSMWGIDPKRITVKAGLLPPQPANSATPDGKAENQRVEISASDLAVLEPVEFRDRDLSFSPKVLSIVPSIKEADDVVSWRSTLKQGGRELAIDGANGSVTSYQWDPSASLSRPRRDQPLIASYTVTNSAGAEQVAHDTLPIDYVTLQMIRSHQEEGKMIERYSLIVFDFNSSQLSAANQRTMERVKARVQPDSKVRIVGYADRTGNPEYNRNLARKRCLEAQRVLGVGDDRVTIDPIGSDTLIYNNDTPEGRSYSRTVQIEIETPIK